MMEIDPVAGFWLAMACLGIGIVIAVGWTILDTRRERRRQAAREIRKRELAQAHPEDWRPLIPRRWRIEGNLRYSFWTAGEAFRKLTQIFGGEAVGGEPEQNLPVPVNVSADALKAWESR